MADRMGQWKRRAAKAEAERDNWEQRALAAEKGNVIQIREMRQRAEQLEAVVERVRALARLPKSVELDGETGQAYGVISAINAALDQPEADE